MGDKKVNVVILPVGSYEQHGPVLPLDTDIKIAEYEAQELTKRVTSSMILPTIPFGMAAEHDGIANTISVSMEHAMGYWHDVLKSIVKNMCDTKLIVLVNGHGGNQSMLETICSQMNYTIDGPKCIVLHVFQPESRELARELFGSFSAHADSVETSVYFAIDEQYAPKHETLMETEIAKRHALSLFPTRQISKDGIVSKMATIEVNPEKGRKILEKSVYEMEEKIKDCLEVVNAVYQDMKNI